MCNPRRIRVRATRTISEQWRAEIVRTASVTDTVTGEARLTHPLASMLAPAARHGFDRAVSSDPAWEWVNGEYRFQAPGGQAMYRPDTGELEIVVQLSAGIEAEGRAVRTATGEVTDEVHSEREVTYYLDGFAGRTRERVEGEGQQTVDAEAEQLAAERGAVLSERAQEYASDAMQANAPDVEAEALADAQRRVTEHGQRVRVELEHRAQRGLDDLQRQILEAVFCTVASGYQHALLDYARQHGAENISVADNDGVIEIAFEMEA